MNSPSLVKGAKLLMVPSKCIGVSEMQAKLQSWAYSCVCFNFKVVKILFFEGKGCEDIGRLERAKIRTRHVSENYLKRELYKYFSMQID